MDWKKRYAMVKTSSELEKGIRYSLKEGTIHTQPNYIMEVLEKTNDGFLFHFTEINGEFSCNEEYSHSIINEKLKDGGWEIKRL